MSARKVRPKTPKKGDLQVTHIRRCHVCGTVNESEQAVNLKCQNCGKHLAPYYYFDESSMTGVDCEGPYLSEFKKSTQFNPIYGLSFYWKDTDERDESHSSRHTKGRRKSS